MKPWAPKQKGFTIVELLIVIVVIAILAAISIVAYNGIQNRAYDTAVQSDLTNFAKKIEQIKITNGDTYPSSLTADMGFRFTKEAYVPDVQGDNVRYCLNETTNQYILYTLSKSGKYYQYTSQGGLQPTTQEWGWGICGKIGLTGVNPTNGLNNGVWANWTN